MSLARHLLHTASSRQWRVARLHHPACNHRSGNGLFACHALSTSFSASRSHATSSSSCGCSPMPSRGGCHCRRHPGSQPQKHFPPYVHTALVPHVSKLCFSTASSAFQTLPADGGQERLLICDHLRARELLADCTNTDGIDDLLRSNDEFNDSQSGDNIITNDDGSNTTKSVAVSAYLGFDPTASSLHVGNLAALMALRVLQRHHGVRPVLLVGSATAMIGDPSGRTTERPMLDKEAIEQNATAIAQSLKGLLDFDAPQTGWFFL